ncbi:1-phosphofructokinase family hexose kinase [Rhizosaccharibacter radicis]|uniref:Phosphofructokinase n=1 Tax=Rhizosaccharibacter radicis TaxID=2782605 RepID=A0ABT1W164_9PROT|nr:1-phosphofructokinase family hexose kinase [Acetobacteraceae bacterium KSS12]
MAFLSCPSLIGTITMNPTIDVAAQTQSVRPTHKLRTFGEREDPGGGGLNVARVVRELGGRALALVLSGGATGRHLEELLAEDGTPFQPVRIAGRTRISHSVTDASNGHEYRFVAEGPTVGEAEWRAVLDAIEALDAGWLIASGSLPPGVPADFYHRVAAVAERRNTPFVLDSSGPALTMGLAGRVHLLKSSLTELEMVAGRALPTRDDQERAASDLVSAGRVAMVALTLGEHGAMLMLPEGPFWLPALNVVVNGTAGAGDSFLAGMVMALGEGRSPMDAFAWGVATGAAAVTAPGTAHPDRGTVERLRGLVRGPARA